MAKIAKLFKWLLRLIWDIVTLKHLRQLIKRLKGAKKRKIDAFAIIEEARAHNIGEPKGVIFEFDEESGLFFKIVYGEEKKAVGRPPKEEKKDGD